MAMADPRRVAGVGLSLLVLALAAMSAAPAAAERLGCAASPGGCVAEGDDVLLHREHVLLQRTVAHSHVLTPDAGTYVVSSGDSVFFKAHTGKRLTVEGGEVHAHWDHQGKWQALTIEKADGVGAVFPGDTVYLQAHTGRYVTAEGEYVHAHWTHRGGWQRFVVERKGGTGPISHGDKVFLQAHTGKRLTVQPSERKGATVHAAWDHQGAWQELTIEKKGVPEPPKPHPEPETTTTTSAALPTPSPPSPPTPSPSLPSSWITGTWTTGYWDCCKPSCSWPNKGKVNQPVRACHAATGFPLEDVNEQSACSGGQAVSCASNAPRAHNATLSFGFAAAAVSGDHGLTGDANCGQCYELRFVGGKHPNGNWGGSHPRLVGKTIVVQVTNIGYDVAGEHSFDLQIPGAGQGAFSDGCVAQFPQYEVGDFDCDNLYGGCHDRSGCERLPLELQAGCEWRYDWYHWLRDGGQTNNPYVDFRRVKCPEQLTTVTNSWPDDDDDFPAIDLADHE